MEVEAIFTIAAMETSRDRGTMDQSTDRRSVTSSGRAILPRVTRVHLIKACPHAKVLLLCHNLLLVCSLRVCLILEFPLKVCPLKVCPLKACLLKVCPLRVCQYNNLVC